MLLQFPGAKRIVIVGREGVAEVIPPPITLGAPFFFVPQPGFTFVEEDGSGGDVAPNGAIGAILNRGSLAGYVAQATGASRPLYKTSGGKHWAECDGTDDNLTIDFGQTVNQPYTFVGAFRPLADANNTLWGDHLNAVQYAGHDNTPRMIAFAGGFIVFNVAIANQDLVITTVFNGASSFLRVNGVETTGDLGSATTSGTMVFGRQSTPSAEPSRCYGGCGFFSSLSAANIETLEAYFSSLCETPPI